MLWAVGLAETGAHLTPYGHALLLDHELEPLYLADGNCVFRKPTLHHRQKAALALAKRLVAVSQPLRQKPPALPAYDLLIRPVSIRWRGSAAGRVGAGDAIPSRAVEEIFRHGSLRL